MCTCVMHEIIFAFQIIYLFNFKYFDRILSKKKFLVVCNQTFYTWTTSCTRYMNLFLVLSIWISSFAFHCNKCIYVISTFIWFANNSENPSFLASSRTQFNKSFCVGNFCLVVNCSRWSIETTSFGGTTRGGASYTFRRNINFQWGILDFGFSKSSITSSETVDNIIGGSMSGANSWETSTRTSITETMQKLGQKNRAVSILVLFRLYNLKYIAGFQIL